MFRSDLLRFVLSSVGLLTLLTAPGRAPAQQPRAPTAAGGPLRVALLVGVDKYRDPAWDTLRGPGNDVQLMERLLTSYDFPKDDGKPDAQKHIRTLIGTAATRQAILEGFRSQLIDKTKNSPTAIAVFYFSGHGSHVPDTTGTTGGDRMTLAPSDRTT